MKNLDIRVRIVAMLFVAIGILVLKTESAIYITLAFAAVWAGCIIGVKKIIPQLVLFGCLEILLYLIKDIDHIGNLPLLVIYIRRLIIAVIMAYPVAKAPTGKLIASLDRLKIPRTMTISLAVLFRFMPTVSMEYTSIRRAQKYREIGTSVKNITGISKLFEYTIVPLLIRTTKIADELTASAEVRGMKLDGDYNPYYEVKMRMSDWLLLLVSILIMAGIFCLDHC
jgi:energy-coupling factor transport system permease protein